MKTDLYITSTNETQIVLTPETELERMILDKMFPNYTDEAEPEEPGEGDGESLDDS